MSDLTPTFAPPQTAAGNTFPWYAVRVRSNFDRRVSTALRNKGYLEFGPFYRARRRRSDRIREIKAPLFPGYIFCRLLDINERLPILKTPGVVDVVKFGNCFINERLPILKTPGVVDVVKFGNCFAPVEEREIESIRRAVQNVEVASKEGAVDGEEKCHRERRGDSKGCSERFARVLLVCR